MSHCNRLEQHFGNGISQFMSISFIRIANKPKSAHKKLNDKTQWFSHSSEFVSPVYFSPFVSAWVYQRLSAFVHRITSGSKKFGSNFISVHGNWFFFLSGLASLFTNCTDNTTQCLRWLHLLFALCAIDCHPLDSRMCASPTGSATKRPPILNQPK